MQALLPAGTFALGVAALSLLRQKRATLRDLEGDDAELDEVARIGRMLQSLHNKFDEEG